jgi:hypothetical protein
VLFSVAKSLRCDFFFVCLCILLVVLTFLFPVFLTPRPCIGRTFFLMFCGIALCLRKAYATIVHIIGMLTDFEFFRMISTPLGIRVRSTCLAGRMWLPRGMELKGVKRLIETAGIAMACLWNDDNLWRHCRATFFRFFLCSRPIVSQDAFVVGFNIDGAGGTDAGFALPDMTAIRACVKFFEWFLDTTGGARTRHE